MILSIIKKLTDFVKLLIADLKLIVKDQLKIQELIINRQVNYMMLSLINSKLNIIIYQMAINFNVVMAHIEYYMKYFIHFNIQNQPLIIDFNKF